MTHTGGLSDTAVFTWTLPGTQVITVTVDNSVGVVTATATITITEAGSDVFLPAVLRPP